MNRLLKRHSSGFTLLELLVVLGIMGLMGAVMMNAPQAMVRAMEERGAMQNVNAFIRTAYQRAQIDRMPTAVYFWNETVRDETIDDFKVVVGKAVAVRQSGRISRIRAGVLVDEFADLQNSFSTNVTGGANGNSEAGMRLYSMSKLLSGSTAPFTLVSAVIASSPEKPIYLGGLESLSGDGTIPSFGFVPTGGGTGDWAPGMAYGFEFQRLELPRGYIFGSSVPGEAGAAVDTIAFRTDGGAGKRITVSAVRVKGMSLTAEKIGESDSPTERIN